MRGFRRSTVTVAAVAVLLLATTAGQRPAAAVGDERGVTVGDGAFDRGDFFAGAGAGAWRDRVAASARRAERFRAEQAERVQAEATSTLLVTTGPRPRPAALAGAAGVAASAVRPLVGGVWRLEVPAARTAAVSAALAARSDVLAVERAGVRTLSAAPNDPAYPEQWAHQVTGVEDAWAVTTGSPDVLVAVVDSGVDARHPDLRDNVVEQVDVSSGTIVSLTPGSDNNPCGDGHGTGVAGVAAAVGDNGLGVAGVAWQTGILDVAVFGPSTGCGGVTDDVVLAGVGYALDAGADVINLSLGGPSTACPTAYQAAFAEATDRGAVVVAASGNDGLGAGGDNEPQVPASCDGVISVGALGRSGVVAPYSNSNAWVDLVAPGGDFTEGPGDLVLTTDRDDGLAPQEGTSFASPYVAGVAALLRAAAPDLTAGEVRRHLEGTARDLGPPGRDPEYGEGLVDPAAAVRGAADGLAAPDPVARPAYPVGADEGGASLPPTDPLVLRVGDAPTAAVRQAVTVSQSLFDDAGAFHAVLAREDDFADALAGSSLGFGFGPLLFSSATGGLAAETAAELGRVLPRGATVYLLGGDAALPARVEDDLRGLGLVPQRLFGAAREETAVVIADEVRRLLPALGFDNLPIAILATRSNWPDAVAAGSLGAYFGIPVLLTDADSLHPATEESLRRLRPGLLYVVGGQAVVSDDVAEAAAVAADAAFSPRLAGGERNATAVAVALEHALVIQDVFGFPPFFAAATNLRRADGFAHVLSATPLLGTFPSVFLPVDGEQGRQLEPPAQDLVRGSGMDGVLVGGDDLVSDEVGDLLEALLRR